MSSPVGSGACKGRWRGFVVLLTACSVAACGPTYPPPRIRVATPSAARSSVGSEPEGATDPSDVTEPEEETETTDSTGTEEGTEATGSADAADESDESEPPATPALPSPPSTSTAAPAPARTSAQLMNATGVVRYRLLIHDNPVDPARAFRCYGGCRQAPTEAVYLECLSECPGFEVEGGAVCGPDEGIPNSVCIVHRPPAPREEPTPGAVVAAVLLNVVVLFSLASICSASASQCGFGYGYRPYSRY
jgi:hypothetical protein